MGWQWGRGRNRSSGRDWVEGQWVENRRKPEGEQWRCQRENFRGVQPKDV